jgi:hypothetical protein
LRDGVFDAAVAGFLLNHLPPGPALAELVRHPTRLACQAASVIELLLVVGKVICSL